MLPLDMFRFNTRQKALVFAVGVCVAFIVGSFAFANGLSTTVRNITDKFETDGLLAYAGDDLFSSVVDPYGPSVDRSFAWVGLVRASVNGTQMTFFAVHDPDSVLGESLRPPPGELYRGAACDLSGQVTLSSPDASVDLWANRSYSSRIFPSFWNLVSWGDLVELRPELADSAASFLLFSSYSKATVSSLRADGLSVQEMTGILGYFAAGSKEVERDLWLIIIPSSLIVALLVYSSLAMEIRDRRKDIAILKTIGASNRRIAGIFLFQALFLCVLGALLGIMLGIIVAYAISTSSAMVIEGSVFFLRVTEYSMLVALVASVLAGIAGSLLPILSATRMSVREALR